MAGCGGQEAVENKDEDKGVVNWKLLPPWVVGFLAERVAGLLVFDSGLRQWGGNAMWHWTWAGRGGPAGELVDYGYVR